MEANNNLDGTNERVIGRGETGMIKVIDNRTKRMKKMKKRCAQATGALALIAIIFSAALFVPFIGYQFVKDVSCPNYMQKAINELHLKKTDLRKCKMDCMAKDAQQVKSLKDELNILNGLHEQGKMEMEGLQKVLNNCESLSAEWERKFVRCSTTACSSIGTISVLPGSDNRCQCKAYVVGASCDRCAPESYHLAPYNPKGCLRCFCSGVTHKCESSGLFRSEIALNYSRGDQDQLEATTSDARSPYSPTTKPQIFDGAINFNAFYEARGQTIYWKLPKQFLGDKITSYGGNLRYTFRFTGSGQRNTEPDVIIRGNGIMLHHKSKSTSIPDRENTIEITIYEQNWVRTDGLSATREHLLMALADLDDILIKMTYVLECSSSSLISVSLDIAASHGTGARALEVEQCECPPGYVGTSCEVCAPGYSRQTNAGLCQKCECYNHASSCDSGVCFDCQHNTEGDHCERCKPGFFGDPRRGTSNDCELIVKHHNFLIELLKMARKGRSKRTI